MKYIRNGFEGGTSPSDSSETFKSFCPQVFCYFLKTNFEQFCYFYIELIFGLGNFSLLPNNMKQSP